MPSEPKRKLTAIMFIDMVGYTAMMQKDERKTQDLVKRHRELIKPLVVKHNGEVLRYIGDGTLCTFRSAIEAVNCAIGIQNALIDKHELNVRIGIHIGDIVFEDDDIYGDGVNIASRLEPLAESGGVCISERVYEDIKNQSDMATAYLGEKSLKNVDHPIKIYCLTGEGLKKAKPFEMEPMSQTSGRKISYRKFVYFGAAVLALLLLILWNLPFFSTEDRTLEASGEIRSIAVLPLDNLSNDPDQDYFSDGMTEALIANIAKIRSLKVISRTSVMRYKGTEKPLPEIGKELNVDAILEGSVMHAEGEVRITVQLIRASTDEHLWADSYTDKLENIMILQSKIAKAIAKEVKLTLSPEEELKLSSNKKIDPAAHEAFLRGKHFWNKRTGDDIKKGLEYFKEAVNIDPLYALAHVGIAESYVLLHQYANLPSRETYPKGKAAALKALEIDPNLGEAHIAIAYALTEHFWDWEAAEIEYKKGLELSPNYATGHQWYGELLFIIGRYDESKNEIELARELDPLSRIILLVESVVHHWSGDLESARRLMDRNIELYPEFSGMYRTKGFFHLTREEYDDAARMWLKAIEFDKSYTEDLEAYREAVKLSGIKGLYRIFLEFDLKQDPINSYFVANDYYILGDYEKSLDWLERAIEDRIFWMIRVNQDPTYSDPVFRTNPRFQAILKKMNFPE